MVQYATRSMPGTLFVVATPIGNLDDITARALRVLREVAVIAAEDTRRTAQLLARYAITTPTTSLHEHNEQQKSAALIARLERGESVALVSDAGTPTISDPGQRLIRQSLDAGIHVEPIPGPSALLAALSVSGLPCETFAFLGFPPTRSKARRLWFDRLRSLGGTIVFFEAPHRIRETLGHIQRLCGDCQTVVCRELTKVHEELVRGPISTVIGGLSIRRGEFTVVINIGHMTHNGTIARPAGEDLAIEIGEITESMGLSRRRALNVLAKRHDMSPNEVYEAIEQAKNLVKKQK
ncbi:MAG: 16S rRNA (cytidine(1402)-2'-O)-methyltransferase [Vicinamibacterales bacterium]